MGPRLLSSDRDFTVFLNQVNPAEVIWEGMASATRLQQLLWQVKAAESRNQQRREAV